MCFHLLLSTPPAELPPEIVELRGLEYLSLFNNHLEVSGEKRKGEKRKGRGRGGRGGRRGEVRRDEGKGEERMEGGRGEG